MAILYQDTDSSETKQNETERTINCLRQECAGFEDQIELLFLLAQSFEDQLYPIEDDTFRDIEFFGANKDNTFDLLEAASVKAEGMFCIISPNGEQVTWVLKTDEYKDPYLTLAISYDPDTEERSIGISNLRKYHTPIYWLPVIHITYTHIALSNLSEIQKAQLYLLSETLPLDLSEYLPQQSRS